MKNLIKEVWPMRQVLTFVLAGGRGERLSPLTNDRAKPAVPFGGTYRIIDFTLSNCINSGIRKINVLIQYKSHSLQHHLRMGWQIFHSELGEYIEVIPAQQRLGEYWYRGTADAIYQNMNTVQQERPEHVLILSGDHVYRMNYAEMLEFHQKSNADVTVSVIEFERQRAGGFGIVEVDAHNQIIGFEEKPKNPKSLPGNPDRSFVSMGIYLFNRSVLEEALLKDAQQQDSTHDFGHDVIPSLMRSHRVMAFNYHEPSTGMPKYWRDIGTLDAYYEANMDLIQVTPPFNLYDREWVVRTYHEQWPPLKTVFSDVEANRIGSAYDSLVSNGCIISGGQVERCILSPDVRINSFAEVTDSILMENVDVGRYAKIKRAIIDKDVVIPRRSRIGYDLEQDRQRFHVTDSGIVVVAKGTIIEETQQEGPP